MQLSMENNRIYKWMQEHYFWSAFLINAFLAILVFVPLCIKYNGVLTFAEDFAGETIPYRYFVRNAIRSGDVFWNWNIDLGSDFMQSFGSCWFIDPFRLIPTLLPEKYILSCTVYLMIARYALAGAGTALYLKRYTRSFSTAMIGSILYAFSGFQASLLVFDMLGDVTVFFPFYMVALDSLVEEDKKGRFAFWVFVLINCSVTMFVGIFFFSVLYFCVKYYEKNKRFFVRMINCIREGIIGGFMAGVSLIPNLYALLNDTRASSKLLGAESLSFDSTRILLILRGWIFPAESLSKSSHLVEFEWCSIGIYLPLIGMLLMLAYIRRKKYDWVKKLLVILSIAAFVPFLNNAFMMESSNPYGRWLYMLILLAVVASCDVIDHYKEYHLYKESMILLLVITGYMYLVYCVPWYKQNETMAVIRPTRLWMGTLMSVIGISFTVFLFRIKNTRIMKSLLLIGICLYSVTTNLIMGHDYQLPSANRVTVDSNATPEIINEVINTGKIFEDMNIEVLPYRTRFWRDYYNQGMIYGIPNRTSFVSVVTSSINTLYERFGEPRVFAVSPDGGSGMNEYLSVKYYISYKKEKNKNLLAQYNNGNRDLYLYEDPDALPIAYTFDTYMLERDFFKLPVDIRTTVSMSALIIPDAFEEDVKTIISPNSEVFGKKYDDQDFHERMRSHLNEVAYDFQKTNKTFSFKIQADSDKYAFITVPYSEYWSVTVNGENQNIIESNGMMTVPVSKGVNVVEFTYKPSITYYACGLSGFGCILFIIYILWERKKQDIRK